MQFVYKELACSFVSSVLPAKHCGLAAGDTGEASLLDSCF